MSDSEPRVLMLHNRYQQAGGEDRVFENEARLLEERGHRVFRYTVHNDSVAGKSGVRLAASTVWGRTSYGEVGKVVRDFGPDVAHFHNTFPLISPSAYYAVRAEGIPVVQTVHNYRLMCLNATFYRDDHVCEDCMGKAVPYPGVLHSCYRDDRAASGAVAAMLSVHRAMKTWKRRVDIYVALTEFARRKLIEAGIPQEKISVKPNFVPGSPAFGGGGGGYFLFVGRISGEKGIETLISAWEKLGADAPVLKVAGDGPMIGAVRAASERGVKIECLGRCEPEEVSGLMKRAEALILPSLWYEGFPMVVAEAYSTGLPVIASDLGGMAEAVSDGRTGYRFPAGNPAALANLMVKVTEDTDLLPAMRPAVEREFLEKYTGQRNYDRLMDIYALAVSRSGASL